MDGMYCETAGAFNFGSRPYTTTNEVRFPPTAIIAQISLATYFEFDDKAYAELGFTTCSYLDSSGVTRTDTFPDPGYIDAARILGRNGLASATYLIRVSNCEATALINFFFWPAVG